MNFMTKHELYSSRDIKTEAKAQLRGHWKEAVLLSLVPTLFTIFFLSDANQNVESISASFDLVNLALRVVQGFLVTGVSFTLLDYIRTREPIEPLRGSVQAFQGKYFLNLLLLKLLKNLYIFLWTLLLLIPGVMKAYSYSQAERIFKDKVDQTGEVPRPADCIKESQELMYGRRLDLFTLDLSFFGWYILAMMTLGIGLLWLTPYTEISQVIFYENLLNQKKMASQDHRTVKSSNPLEEVGKDPDDFSDFEDF